MTFQCYRFHRIRFCLTQVCLVENWNSDGYNNIHKSYLYNVFRSVFSIFTLMSQFRRDYFELKQVEAIDIADSRSYAVHRKTSLSNRAEYRPKRSFCTLHSNRNCSECKKKKTLPQKRRKQRTLGMDLLVNDFNGFNWSDPKVNEYQKLNVAGRRIETSEFFHHGGVFQNKRLFFPELALNRPLLVTEQAQVYGKLPRKRAENLKRYENEEQLPIVGALSRESFQNKGQLHLLPRENRERLKWLEDEKGSPEFRVLASERKESLQSVEDNARSAVFRRPDGLEIGSSSELKVLESTGREKRRINVVLPRIS